MDKYLSKDDLAAFVKANLFPVLLGIGGLIFLGYGLIALSGAQDEKSDIVFEAKDETAMVKKASTGTKKEITIDIEGAVEKPGIYTLEADSRINDALLMAGGMSKEADRGKVTKSLNLAAKLIDGGKIYIPFVGEETMTSTGQDGSSVLGMGSSDGGINLNTATQKELESLPGIGEVTAKKIIDARPFGSVEELQQKKVVGQKVFGQIKDKVSVY